MQQIRPQGAVLLEMLTPINKVRSPMSRNKCKAILIFETKITRSVALEYRLVWAQFGNLVKYLLAQPYPVLAANINRDAVMEAYNNPPKLTGKHSTQPVIQALINETIKRSHNGELDDIQSNKMMNIQQLRDRAMAQGLLDAPAPAVLFAGGYHATRAIGVPLHVLDLAPNEPLKVLIISEVGEEIDNLHADYVWYTPK